MSESVKARWTRLPASTASRAARTTIDSASRSSEIDPLTVQTREYPGGANRRSVDVPGIGPTLRAGDDIELGEEAADNLVGVGSRAEVIELVEDFAERLFDVADSPFRVVLTLLLEAALTFEELFAVEVGTGIEDGLALRASIGQEARQTVP